MIKTIIEYVITGIGFGLAIGIAIIIIMSLVGLVGFLSNKLDDLL